MKQRIKRCSRSKKGCGNDIYATSRFISKCRSSGLCFVHCLIGHQVQLTQAKKTNRSEEILFLATMIRWRWGLGGVWTMELWLRLWSLNVSQSQTHASRERERAGMGSVALPFVGMMMAECAQVGLMIVAKAAMTRGMSNLVFIFYSNAFASLILLPTSFLFHRYSLSLSLTGYNWQWKQKSFLSLVTQYWQINRAPSALFPHSLWILRAQPTWVSYNSSFSHFYVKIIFWVCFYLHRFRLLFLIRLCYFGFHWFDRFYSFVVQILGYAGVLYSSPTLGTAMLNLIPAFTFILAVTFRSCSPPTC